MWFGNPYGWNNGFYNRYRGTNVAYHTGRRGSTMSIRDRIGQSSMIESTKPRVNVTKPRVNVTKPRVNNTRPRVNNTRPRVNNTRPRVNNTRPRVNNTRPVIRNNNRPNNNNTRSVRVSPPRNSGGRTVVTKRNQ